jgi:hypothetical protein
VARADAERFIHNGSEAVGVVGGYECLDRSRKAAAVDTPSRFFCFEIIFGDAKGK